VVKIAGIDLPGLNLEATRFAPSPNGLLHVGHAYSAMCAHDFAREQGARFLLRIEDIDGTRSRAEHIEAVQYDLDWLGLSWDGAVIYQSSRIDDYRDALSTLHKLGLVYRCTCSRSEIVAAIACKPVTHGPDGPVYPGTCRAKDHADATEYAWRIDMARAVSLAGMLAWTDLAAGRQIADPMVFGDVVLWRKDAPASYHLAATLDDATDGISHVVRGQDLFAYTAIHRLLQVLLALPAPVYWHHPLLLDKSGQKLAKSRLSAPLAALREAGQDGAELITALRAGKLPLGILQSTS
jgi:glutamyl-Q tRNA(Asp) synthetase